MRRIQKGEDRDRRSTRQRLGSDRARILRKKRKSASSSKRQINGRVYVSSPHVLQRQMSMERVYTRFNSIFGSNLLSHLPGGLLSGLGHDKVDGFGEVGRVESLGVDAEGYTKRGRGGQLRSWRKKGEDETRQDSRSRSSSGFGNHVSPELLISEERYHDGRSTIEETD